MTLKRRGYAQRRHLEKKGLIKDASLFPFPWLFDKKKKRRQQWDGAGRAADSGFVGVLVL